MSKHTPGPWRLIKSGSSINIYSDTDTNTARICTEAYNAPESKEEQIANARLVAAAPEMFAVLHRLIFVFDKRKNFAYENFEDTVNMAREAIAKAEGK